MADYVTLDQAKSWLGFTTAENDGLLRGMVASANDAITEALGGSLLRQRYTETLSGPGGTMMPVNHRPIRSVTAVKIAGATIPASQYTFDDGAIYLTSGTFTRGRKNVVVEYQGGHDDVPASLVMAGQMTVKAMWDARLTDMNATSESFSGIGGSGFWPTGPGSIPPAARTFIAPYLSHYKVT